MRTPTCLSQWFWKFQVTEWIWKNYITEINGYISLLYLRKWRKSLNKHYIQSNHSKVYLLGRELDNSDLGYLFFPLTSEILGSPLYLDPFISKKRTNIQSISKLSWLLAVSLKPWFSKSIVQLFKYLHSCSFNRPAPLSTHSPQRSTPYWNLCLDS